MLKPAQYQELDGVVADRAQTQGVLDGAMERPEIESLQETQDLHVFPLAGLAQAGFQQTAQS